MIKAPADERLRVVTKEVDRAVERLSRLESTADVEAESDVSALFSMLTEVAMRLPERESEGGAPP